MKTTALLLALLALACSDADTLGDEPPRELVITGNPTFENGISALLDLKCAYCHGVPRPDIAPADITSDLDLSRYETVIVDGRLVRGADAIGRWLEDGIMDHALDIYVDFTVFPEAILEARQMPLDYGTQLTDREKGYLLSWSANGSPRNDLPEPAGGDPIAGRSSYLINCGSCHGVDGQGRNAPTVDASDPIRWYGPPIRKTTATTAKIKSMYLHKTVPLNGVSLEPISDGVALDIRAYLIQ